MNLRSLALITMAVGLTGCLQTDEHGQVAPLLSQVPIESVTLPIDYIAAANCAYVRLDKAIGPGLKKTDLQNEVRIALEGSTRQWELIFTPAGKNSSVAFTQAQTMWGPLGGKEIMPIVRSCAP